MLLTPLHCQKLRGAQPRPGPVNTPLLASVLESVQEQCTAAAKSVLEELGQLFGSTPLPDAANLLYPVYRAEGRTEEQVDTAFDVLGRYCGKAKAV